MGKIGDEIRDFVARSYNDEYMDPKELLALADRIDAEMNNKRSYALARAAEAAFVGEPAECSCYGTRESAEAVTAADAYAAYLRILKTAQVEIYYVAPEPNDKAAEMFRREFAAIERKSRKCTFRTVSPAKSEPSTVTEEMDVLQCKTALTFKSDSDDIYALRVMSAMLGELRLCPTLRKTR